MVVYCLIGIIHGMGFNYLCTVFSTIEKQFEIKSEETVWIFSSNEFREVPCLPGNYLRHQDVGPSAGGGAGEPLSQDLRLPGAGRGPW